MTYSLNEVTATAKRATRGAGYSWGMAEEAGKATRWLCAQNQDGVQALAAVLDCGFAESLQNHTPVQIDTDWTAPGQICALSAGVLLSDYAALLAPTPKKIHNLACPIFLLPFAATVAQIRQCCVTLRGDGMDAITDGTHLMVQGIFPNTPCDVSIEFSAKTTAKNSGTAANDIPDPIPTSFRATPAPNTWNILNRFAHKTYAPATEESRRLGAGAGLSDND